MSTWRREITDAVSAFTKVSRLAGTPIRRDQIEMVLLSAPHLAPTRLPEGKIAIYGFWGDGEWLKIGMAGAKTKARYTSQHYNMGSAPSTLAGSIARDSRMTAIAGSDKAALNAWVKASCHRANILIDAAHGVPLLALFEAFLHVRLKPRYERKRP
jgi:hypothetical protein